MLDVSYYYIYIANHAQDSNLAFPPLSTSIHLVPTPSSSSKQANRYALCPTISAGSIFC